jgi:hypothetical protein
LSALLRCLRFAQPRPRRVAETGLETGSEFGEGDADTIMDGLIDGEFVVATAQVLHERVTWPRCAATSWS